MFRVDSLEETPAAPVTPVSGSFPSALSLSVLRFREAEPGGPGGLGADREVGSRGQPAERSSMHQQVAVGARRRHQRAAQQTLPRAVQKLPPHLPAAGLSERGQQDPDDGSGEPSESRTTAVFLQKLLPSSQTSCLWCLGVAVARQHERIGVLAEVCSAGSQRRAELLLFLVQETGELVHLVLADTRQRGGNTHPAEVKPLTSTRREPEAAPVISWVEQQ